jgi:hypothetical protein
MHLGKCSKIVMAMTAQKTPTKRATMIQVRIKATGGWIDVSYDGATIVMAAVGTPLNVLVKEPKNLTLQQKRTQERGRYRRMALDALRAAGAPDEVEEAEWTWDYRAG